MKVGSLCTGYGGLDLAIGGEVAFVSEIDKHACTVLEARFPDVPNLGDLTELDTLPEMDVLTAGFPCQPVSQAGQRKGTDDERWLWDDIERLLGNMGRPPAVVFLENVRGLLSANGGDAMARVVQGLAGLGYVGSYRVVSAASVGACHRRERVFIRAHLADADGRRFQQRDPIEWGISESYPGGGDAADAEYLRRQGAEPKPQRNHGGGGEGSGLFGPYWPAVSRWGRILGRPAPAPTDAGSGRRVRGETGNEPGVGRPDGVPPERGESQRQPTGSARLNPRFVEWMMGLPDGWVCDLDLPRTAQLKILGNGVVPQQAAHAWRLLTQPAHAAAVY